MYQINSCIKHNNEIINSEFKLIDRSSAYHLIYVRQEIDDSPISCHEIFKCIYQSYQRIEAFKENSKFPLNKTPSLGCKQRKPSRRLVWTQYHRPGHYSQDVPMDPCPGTGHPAVSEWLLSNPTALHHNSQWSKTLYHEYT